MPVWEAALVQIGFVGMGLGLAIALPTYMRRRRPDAFAGRLGDRREGSPRALPWTAVVSTAVVLIWLYWAAGGTAGVVHRGERDLAWHVLSGVFGLWAFVASAATWAAVRGRPARLPDGPTADLAEVRRLLGHGVAKEGWDVEEGCVTVQWRAASAG
jgi:hypothetical protein